MTKQFLNDTVLWGVILWCIGYMLGLVLFTVIPQHFLGWIIMPFGIGITLWVLLKKVKVASFHYYIYLAACWTSIAVVFDYFFLVRVFNLSSEYYKLDVYLYYMLTFALPLVVGWRKDHGKNYLHDKTQAI